MNEIKYNVAVKYASTNNLLGMGNVSEVEALTTVRAALKELTNMEETSVDLKALNFMIDVNKGKVMTIENIKGNRTITVQKIV